MADRTSNDNEITREEFASNLRVIADAFEDDGDVDSDVENKTISLYPPDVIEYEIAVGEGSSVIGSDSERVSIEAEWTPEN
jgi:amphi-Trp domain-containing protein